MTTRAISSIAAIEQVPLADWRLSESTSAALLSSAARTPNAKALSFFRTASAYDRPHTWTYGELVAEVTRAANVFHAMGVTAEHPVAFVLPNLPETHFTIWGGEAAGAVLALNPLLEPAQLARLLRAARARVLVTLPPAPGAELWKRLSVELAALPDLKHVAWVNLACYFESADSPQTQSDHRQVKFSGFDIVDLRTAMNEQPSEGLVWERQIAPGDISSYFCTGGTTGLPKIAVRTHGAEVFDAWSVAKVLESDGSPRTFFCGLPLFHVNAQLVTGLLPWMCGDHVVLGTPEGYRGQGVVQRFWEIVSHYRVTMFSGVPAIYASLLEVPVGASDISSLQFAICGAAPMPVKLIEAFEFEDEHQEFLRAMVSRKPRAFPPSIRRMACAAPAPLACESPTSACPPSCSTGTGASYGRPRSTKLGSSRSGAPTYFQATSTPATTKGCGPKSAASAGSTPAISGGRMPMATFGLPVARKS